MDVLPSFMSTLPCEPASTVDASHPPLPSFATPRLIFVPLAARHADDLVSMQSDPHVCRYLIHDVYSAYDNALGLVRYSDNEHARQPGLGIWHVSSRTDGRFIGIFSLHRVEPLNSVQLGVVFSRNGWGKRLIPDFARVVLDYGFRVLGERRLISLTDPANRPAAFWLEAYGFRLKTDVLADGVPQLLYVIEHAEWERLHGGPDNARQNWRQRAGRG